jgi:hypothetical protein
MSITLEEMKGAKSISCVVNNHKRHINRYDDKIACVSKYGSRYLTRRNGRWLDYQSRT